MPERFDPQGYIQKAFDFEAELGTTEEVRRLHRLHESLAPYLDVDQLRQLAAEHGDLYAALRSDAPPAQIRALIETLSVLLRPPVYEQIRSPHDVAAFLMVQMGHLDQEEMRTVLLDTKNRVQDIVTIYRGSLNTSLIRLGELYKPAIRRNSAAIILAHNHPSGEPEPPSPEDILITRQAVEAGKLLDIDCLDHLIIGKGKWISLRERGLGFKE